ncbi:MAG: ankyrin repeat domain-containing protein [Opitutaceae bacterium]|jgi:hypothetical protein
MPLLRFVILALLIALIAPAQAAGDAKSPWLGTWSAKLGEYGIIALSVGDKGDGVPSRAEVWWLADVLRPTGIRIEGDTLFIDLPDHKRTSMPGLALRLTDKGTLRFTSYGVLSAPLDPLYAAVEFTRPTNIFFWHQTTDFRANGGEYDKWHESGSLKPLPTIWPASVTAPLLRLFAYNDHLFYRVVVLPSLSEADLVAAYAWTKDKNIWSNGPDSIRRLIGQNPNTPVSILTELWNHPDNSLFWIAAAQNPRAPAEWRAALIDRILSGSDNAQSRAIWTGDGPPELYLRLIEKKPALRGRIAATRNMPAAVYERLARDYPQDSVSSLITNPSVPVALLEMIAVSADRNLQLSLINNPTLPAATRTRLVRQILAQATPADFARFAHDRDATPEFLARCSADLEPGIRTYVAHNTNTPETLLLALAEDPSRPVATAARESLQQRFPETFNLRKAGLSSLESRAEDVPLFKQFENAVGRGDLPEIKRLASYYKDRGTLDSTLSQTARFVIRDGYRPEVMDFYLEQGYDRYGGSLARLAGECGGNRQWLDYFKRKGAFQKTYSANAYTAALDSRKPENLAGLIAAKVDPNQPNGNNQTSLHRAVLLHDLGAIEALLRAGADPTLTDARGQSPLDYAVVTKFIPAIRLLDKNGRHAALVAEFVKDFPPAPASAFLGTWTNNKDGFNTVSILLNADGSGRFGGGVIGGFIAWREVSRTEAVACLYNEKGEVERRFPIKLSLDPSTQVVTFTPPQGEVQRMIRPANN